MGLINLIYLIYWVNLPHHSYPQTPGVLLFQRPPLHPGTFPCVATNAARFRATTMTTSDRFVVFFLNGGHSTYAMVEIWDWWGMVWPSQHQPLLIMWSVPLYTEKWRRFDHTTHDQKIPKTHKKDRWFQARTFTVSHRFMFFGWIRAIHWPVMLGHVGTVPLILTIMFRVWKKNFEFIKVRQIFMAKY